MSFLLKYRFWIVSAVVVAGVVLVATQLFKAHVPDITNFITSEYSFTYPRTFSTEEYAPGVVSIGHQRPPYGLVPFVDVNIYKSDPQSKLPSSFDAFAKAQAAELCGSDDSVASITCTQKSVAPYTSAEGLIGTKMELTATFKNLKTGTTTSSTYGPLYVFDTTASATREAGAPLRYSGVFVYQSFTAFLAGTSSPALLNQVVDTLTLPTKK